MPVVPLRHPRGQAAASPAICCVPPLGWKAFGNPPWCETAQTHPPTPGLTKVRNAPDGTARRATARGGESGFIRLESLNTLLFAHEGGDGFDVTAAEPFDRRHVTKVPVMGAGSTLDSHEEGPVGMVTRFVDDRQV